MPKFMGILMVCLFATMSTSAQSYLPFADVLKKNVTKIEETERIQRFDKLLAVRYALQHGIPTITTTSDGKIAELQSIEKFIPRYYQTNSVTSAQTINVDSLWNLPLNGDGQTIGLWDEAKVLSTHRELTPRVTQIDAPTTFSAHSTHVSGTMVGYGITPLAHGMAKNASVNAYDWNNDLSEVRSAALQWLKVSNHSYGLISGWAFGLFGDGKWVWLGDTTISTTIDYHFGFYTSQSRDWDSVAHDYPYYLVCKAAGNDRMQGPSTTIEHWIFSGTGWVLSSGVRNKDGGPDGFDCIEGIGVSKNVLTVGAVYSDTVYSGAGSVSMTSFSGWGPTDDGRIKPDVVAMGVSEYSCTSTNDSSYAYMSGTSMATPSVTGAIALLLQHQSNLHPTDSPLLSSTLKGLIIHTADEAGTTSGPDYKFGWGLMNASTAASVMTKNANRNQNWDIQELNLTNSDTISIDGYSDGSSPIKVTICWTDNPAQVLSPSLNTRTRMLKNDLDIRILKSGTIFYPWVLDPNNPPSGATTGDNNTDNVEQVYISQPTSGNYTLVLSHKGTLINGSQNVSMIITGLNPSALNVSAGSDTSVCKGNPIMLMGSVSGASSPIYSWTIDGQTSVLSASISLIVSPTSTTTYRFTATDGGKTAFAKVTVNVNQTVIANAGRDTTITLGNTLLLSADTTTNVGSAQYTWYVGGSVISTSPSLIVQPSATTLYALSVSNNTCVSKDTVKVTVQSTVSANAGQDISICPSTQFTIVGSGTGSGALAFRWVDLSTSRVVSNTKTLTQSITSTRSYSLRVIDAMNSIANDTVKVTVNKVGMSPTFSNSSACTNIATTYTSTDSVGVTYAWTLPNGGGTIVNGNTNRSVIVVWTSTGTKYLTLQQTNTSGCSASVRKSINVTASPTPTITATTTRVAAIGQTKSYRASSSTSMYHHWDVVGGTITSGQNTATVTILWTSAVGSSITLTQTKISTGCVGSTTMSVAIIQSTSTSSFNDDNSNMNSIKVYPNPAGDVLFVEYEISNTDQNTANIGISSLKGETLENKKSSISNNFVKEEFDISDFPNGTYIVYIRVGNSVQSAKFIKLK